MMIQNARISFPNIHRPSAFNPGDDPKFSATFILEDGDPQVEEIKAEMRRVAADKWADKVPARLKKCLRSGSEKAELDGFGDGTWFFNASNKKRPGVFDRDRSALVEEDGKPYAGCYVNVIVDFWAQDNNFGKRINASLQGVQFSADGDSFGGAGRSAGADDFSALDDDDSFLD